MKKTVCFFSNKNMLFHFLFFSGRALLLDDIHVPPRDAANAGNFGHLRHGRSQHDWRRAGKEVRFWGIVPQRKAHHVATAQAKDMATFRWAVQLKCCKGRCLVNEENKMLFVVSTVCEGNTGNGNRVVKEINDRGSTERSDHDHRKWTVAQTNISWATKFWLATKSFHLLVVVVVVFVTTAVDVDVANCWHLLVNYVLMVTVAVARSMVSLACNLQ